MLIPYLVGAGIVGALGYTRYKQVKVGDLIQAKVAGAGVTGATLQSPAGPTAVIKVTSLANGNIYGTVINGATNTDTGIPVYTTPANVVANLTPRLM